MLLSKLPLLRRRQKQPEQPKNTRVWLQRKSAKLLVALKKQPQMPQRSNGTWLSQAQRWAEKIS